MKFELVYPNGGYPMLRAWLEPGEVMLSESGAMVGHDMCIELSGKMTGGFKKAFARSLAGGESFFQVVSTNKGTMTAHCLFAPKAPGEILLLEIGPELPDLNMADGAFLASAPNVVLGNRSQGLGKAIFGSGGFFVLHASCPDGGRGLIACNSFGCIHRVDLNPGQSYVVDNGHLIAWTCQYALQKAAKGWFSTAKTGEGIVCVCTGPGSVWMKSRNIEELAHALIPYLPRPRQQ